MSDFLEAFQRRHQEKLDHLQRDEVDEAFLDGVQLLIADLRQAGAAVGDSAERGQLRTLMYFWGNLLYDETGVYPDTMLQPLNPDRTPPPEEETLRRSLPPLSWVLVGGAAVIIIVVGLIAVGWFTRLKDPPAPTPTLRSRPILGQSTVGSGLGAGGALEGTADTFCRDVPEIVAALTLEGIEPEMDWRWEVKRDGEIVASQPATPWGSETQSAAIHALPGGAKGVDAGQYDLLVYVDGQMVDAHSFRVLDAAPRAFDLRVADAPETDASLQTEGEPEERAFGDGVRVIYLNYEYEGFCPGMALSHVLYQGGEVVQESAKVWSGAWQGQGRVSFQAPGDRPFPPGKYEVGVTVAGEEQSRVKFTVGDVTPEEAANPAFDALSVALGIQPDGDPILTEPDNVFDWNTKSVYGVFEYTGMRDDVRWAVVWMRNQQEVAREEHFWDVDSDGAEGVRWVVYYDEDRRVLPGGQYSVTLYIDDVAQRAAEFRILYYVPE